MRVAPLSVRNYNSFQSRQNLPYQSRDAQAYLDKAEEYGPKYDDEPIKHETWQYLLLNARKFNDDIDSAICEYINWENEYDTKKSNELKQKQRQFIKSQIEEEEKTRKKLYSKEGEPSVRTSEQRFYTHKTYSDYSSIHSSYDKDTDEQYPQANFSWSSDTRECAINEESRIKYNLHNDRRLNINAKYFQTKYGAVRELTGWQSVSINLDNGKVKAKLYDTNMAQFKNAIYNTLSLARNAKVELPYEEIYNAMGALE